MAAVSADTPAATTYVLPGLTEAAEIIVDRWGVPHIYAATPYDAFRAQGFNAARDRLWQIDFWRRRGLGLLSEVFGSEHVDRDRAARLFLYRGDMHDDWLSYGSDTKRAATAFVEGVNSFVQLTRDDPSLLPAEFVAVGYAPAFWSPTDVSRIRSHGLFYNVREEVTRALTIRDYGLKVERLRRRLEPEHDLVVPEGLDLSCIPDDVLAVYDLATTPPVFGPVGDQKHAVLPEGSNNWVVSGTRTASGRPLLANDPHRAAAALPGLRYLAHLSAPGFDVIGGGEPGLPGISIGHNGTIAFGLTIFAVDQEDLYVYETNPDNPLEYRYQGRWEPMRVEHEQIAVKDGAVAEIDLVFTRHGPVVYQDPVKRTAFAVRAAWLQPGMAPYLGSMDYMRAKNWDEFLGAMNRWGAPPENQVYADVSGNIGWKTGGLTPIRPNWDGTLPVPGDGRYEWAGYYDMDELPGAFNPEAGWLATANEMNLPKDYPSDRHITYDWYAPYRRHRIDALLKENSRATLADMVRMQSDFVSLPALHIVERLRQLPLQEADTDEALQMLLTWDGDLRAESGPAALFEVWYRRYLRPALINRALEQVLPAADVSKAMARIAPKEDLLADARIDLELLESPEGLLGENAEAFLVEAIGTTLKAAFAEVADLLGPNVSEWSWGRLHGARASHPLAAILGAVDATTLSVGPLPRGGSGDTVGNTAYGPNFMQASGSTFRVAIDVGDWDESLAMNAPGQAGRLGDRHQTDLFEPWVNGDAFPLLYTRARVEMEAEQIIRLEAD